MCGWVEGVKMFLGSRGITVVASRQCANDKTEWRALVPEYSRGPVRRDLCFWTSFPRSYSFVPGQRRLRGQAFHAAVWVNGKLRPHSCTQSEGI